MTSFEQFIKRAKELCDNATPGPWHYDCGNGEVESHNEKHWRISVADRPCLSKRIEHCRDFCLGYNPPDFPVHPDMDMEFIAASRDMLPKAVEALEMAIRRLSEISEVTSEIDELSGTWARKALTEIECILESNK